jgi:16S rRNA (guanine966-N2)-methyltransferase
MSLKITGGLHRSRMIETPPGNNTRPSASLLREALFNILGDISGLDFVDCFAGSGCVGIEALSRGAKSSSFVELDRKTSQLIEKNLQTLNLNGEVICANVKDQMERWIAQNRQFDILFLDPPFIVDYPDDLPWEGLMKKDGIVIFQAPSKKWPSFLNSAEKIKMYGESGLAFFYV